MTVYFSEKTQAFYATDIDYPNMPDDIILIESDLEHNRLLNMINSGNKVSIIPSGFDFIPISPTITWDAIRAKRDGELSRTDYTQMPDWPGDKTIWATYRQKLRDITTDFSSPEEVIWPNRPE
jgi:hypothetical protein